MAYCIDRQAAVDALILLQDHSDMPEDWHKGVSASMSCLFRVPFVERKKGKWIGTDTKFGIRIYHCSECKADLMQLSVTRYCPNCGAEMESE